MRRKLRCAVGVRDCVFAVMVAVMVLPEVGFGGGAASFVQEHFRWRNDDGGETVATWKAAADSAITNVIRGQNIRLRFSVANTGAYTGSLVPLLEYGAVTAGPWTPVSRVQNGAEAFEMATSSLLGNGDATTALLPGSGAFIAGKCVEAPSNSCASISYGTNQYANFEYVFRATARAHGSGIYYFRLSNNGTALTTYTNYPRLTIAAGEANEPAAIVSQLAATGSVTAAFAYAIQASGSEPITIGVSGLPAGLTFNGTNRIAGTPAAAGTYSVGLAASNPWGSDSKTLALKVLANNPPVAQNSSVNATAGAQAYCTLAASHADTGQTLTYRLVQGARHGSVLVNAGSAYYTSDSAYAGGDSFTWVANDGIDDSNPATVTITVNGVAPAATNQVAIAAKNTSLSIHPSYVGGGGYTCALARVAGPSHGTLTTNGMRFVYTPATNYVGSDSFTWRVAYSNSAAPLTNTATVTCSIKVKDAGPEADWTQWRFDECRSAQSPHVLPDQLYLQWRRDVPAFASSFGSSFPDLDYCRPVQIGKNLIVSLQANDSVTAYDTDTGAQKWRYYASGALRRPPVAVALAGGTNVTIFGSDDGYVYCLNVADGTEMWKFRAAPNARKAMGFGRLSSVWPVWASPVAYTGKVYFVAGFDPSWCLFGYCLDAATGAVVWRNDGRMVEDGHNSALAPLTFSYDHTKIYGTMEGKNRPWVIDPITGELTGHSGSAATWFIDGSGVSYGGEPTGITAGGQTFTPSSVAGLGVAGPAGSMLAGDGKLFVWTTTGSIYCFGGAQVTPNIYTNQVTPLPAGNDVWTTVAQTILSRADLKQGLALVWGVGSGRLVEELAKQASGLMVVAADPDPVKLRALRVKMDAAGWSGARVSTVQGNPMECGFAPYQAALIVSEDVGAAGYANERAMAEMLYKCTRPFGGEIWLPTMESQHSAIVNWLTAANLPTCSNQSSYAVARQTGFTGLGVDGFTRISRTGLPDSRLVLKPPFGLIAFGPAGTPDTSASSAPQRGVKGGYDIYSWLPVGATMTGYEPPAPVASGKKSVTVNPLYSCMDKTPSVSVYGCCQGKPQYGDIMLNPGKVGSFYNQSDYWGIMNLPEIGGCMVPKCFAGNGIVAFSTTTQCTGCNPSMRLSQVALVPMDDEENWINYKSVLSQHEIQETPVRRVGVNLGAVGDIYLSEESMVWTHHPAAGRHTEAKPLIHVSYRGNAKQVYHNGALVEKTNTRHRGWVSASQVTGMDGVTIPLAQPVVALRTSTPPAMDGVLGDGCWDGQKSVRLTQYSWWPLFSVNKCDDACYAMVRYDDANLYIAGGVHGALNLNGQAKKSMSITLNSRERSAANVTLSCGENGKSSSGVSSNDWQAAYSTTSGEPFTAEIAIPWSVLESAGLWKEQLIVSVDICMSALTASGSYTPLYLDAARGLSAQAKSHTVRLYFAEMEDKAAGQR
ncbi:MAG: hypothetical protein C0404_13905, partial [Verrucomicrobia bacterium]|nr:hypothetical protein [Verrucomicrobiota bacterium]